MKTITTEWRASVLFLLALFLRLTAIDHINLIGDVGRDYLQATDMVQGKAIPLMGIPSSVPRFMQGPYNIWFDALSFRLWGVNVYSPVVLAALVTVFGCVLLYSLLHREVGKNTSFIASLLMVVSPAAVSQSRMPFYLFAVPIFVVMYLFALLNLKKKDAISVFIATLCFFLLFQWELATIPLIVLLPMGLYLNRIKIRTMFLPLIGGVILGLLPQIAFDFTHRCQQLCQFVVWMGYRTVAVSGIDHRHGLTALHASFWQELVSQLMNLVGYGWIPLVVVMGIIAIGLWRKRRSIRSPLYIYTLVGSLCLFFGLIIHGDPSEAYFPPFIVFIPILLAFSLEQFRNVWSILIRVLVVSVCVVTLVIAIQTLQHLASIRPRIETASFAEIPLPAQRHFETDGDDVLFLIRTRELFHK